MTEPNKSECIAPPPVEIGWPVASSAARQRAAGRLLEAARDYLAVLIQEAPSEAQDRMQTATSVTVSVAIVPAAFIAFIADSPVGQVVDRCAVELTNVRGRSLV